MNSTLFNGTKFFRLLISSLVISLLTPIWCTWGHDLKIAYFEISRDKAGYHLQINFDKDDLAKCLTSHNADLKGEKNLQKWEKAATAYVLKNVKIALENQATDIKIIAYKYDENYARISCRLSTTVKHDAKSIQISNQCLIESIEGHSNILHVKLHGKTRSFRLNKDRISTEVIY